MKPRVYLAGPIAHTDQGEATNWRIGATYKLGDHGIETLDPMRAKSRLSTGPIGGNFRDYQDFGLFYTSGAIMARDMADVSRADALLVNLLGARTISTGTAMEMVLAWRDRKPMVVVIEPHGNPHDAHPMVHEAIGSLRVASLAEGIETIAIILNR